VFEWRTRCAPSGSTASPRLKRDHMGWEVIDPATDEIDLEAVTRWTLAT
jgi:hypothetical protein